MKIKPRIFISYSRHDFAIASAIYTALSREGYTIFFDTESIQIGDIFPERIVESIKKSDGCLILISDSSVKSEWCKLEIYYAHFYNKLLIPIKLGDHDFDSNSPIKNIQKNIHYVLLKDPDKPQEVIGQIRKSLTTIKQKARLRLVKLTGWIALIILLATGFFVFGIKQINQLAYDREKNTLLSDLKNSKTIYRTEEIELIKQKFSNDKDLIMQLRFKESQPDLSEAARINCKILSSALLQSFPISQRQFFKQINWNRSEMQNNIFVNSTFSSGSISQTKFKNSEFDDIYFVGSGNGQEGVKLSGLQFSNCSFNTVYFDGTNAIDLTFQSCRFRGSVINTTNFGAVNFLSDTVTNSPVITNGQVSFFENCVFENSNPPDPPGTIVLGKEEEMQFINVVFEGCRFSGLVRPEWFKRCSFTNCTFPSDSLIAQIRTQNFIN